MATFLPKLHRAFIEHLAPDERADPLPAYWRHILNPDSRIHAKAAWIWHDIERALSNIEIASEELPIHDPDGPLPSTPFMEAHYFAKNCFLHEDQILTDMPRIAHIPAVLVQGRYDLLCPPSTSARLAAQWPAARLVMAEMAGHSMAHTSVFNALKEAITDLA